MQNEDDLRGLAKVMDFMRAISILFVVINIYWFCYQSFREWGINIGVVDKILLNFQRTAGCSPTSVHQTFFGGVPCAFLFGYKRSERGKNHMEQDLCIPDNRFYPVFPKLVAVGYAVTTGDKHGIVYLYHDSRVSFAVGCRSMDFTLIEK